MNEVLENIFDQVEEKLEASIKDTWVTEDEMGEFAQLNKGIEFLGFYDKDDNIVEKLSGGEDNKAVFKKKARAIRWDLQNSKVKSTETDDNGGTIYTYKLKYRVRLENELEAFVTQNLKEEPVNTNGKTTLKYKISKDGKLSDELTVDFPSPSVKGYLGEINFTKVNEKGDALSGVKFKLVHKLKCSVCEGKVNIDNQTATSDADGVVSFKNIPSGHEYTMTETKTVSGYKDLKPKWSVEVAYGKTTVEPMANNNQPYPDYSSSITTQNGEDNIETVRNDPIPSSKKDVFLSEDLQNSVDGQMVAPGSTLHYVINYANDTLQKATVTVVDTLPENVTVLTDTISDDGIYDEEAGTITWTINDVDPYGGGQVSFDVTLTKDAWKQSIDNSASVTVNNGVAQTNTPTNTTHNTTPHKDVFAAGNLDVSIDTQRVRVGDLLVYGYRLERPGQ